jgi:hypothetical protein
MKSISLPYIFPLLRLQTGICRAGKYGSVSSGDNFRSLPLYQYAIALADCVYRFDLDRGTRQHLVSHAQLQTDIQQFSLERIGKIDFNQSHGCLLVQVKTAVMRNK